MNAVKMSPAKRRLLWLFFSLMAWIDDAMHFFGIYVIRFCEWSQCTLADLEYVPKINICPTCEDETEIETWKDKYGIFYKCRVCGDEFDLSASPHRKTKDR